MAIRRDLHNNVDVVTIIPPVAVGTTGVGQTGAVIDLLNYSSCEIVVGVGAITATGAVITPVVKDGEATGSLTSVADTWLLGTEANAGVGATATRVDGVSENVVGRLGYVGINRYLSVDVSSTVTAGTPVYVNAILHRARVTPVAT